MATGETTGGLDPRRKWALVAGIALMLVALLLAALLTARTGRSGPSTATPGQPAPTKPAAAGPSAPQPTASQTSVGLPTGWQLYRDPSGFSVPVPVGWVRSNDGSIVYFREPNGPRVLGIDQTDQPRPDPVADWTQQEGQRANAFYPGYQRVRIAPVSYWLRAADWEFTYNEGGARVHVINRGFVTSNHQAYAIWWATPDAAWADNLRYFELITNWFQPKQ